MFEITIGLYALAILRQHQAEMILILLGYRKKPALYGSILFSRDEWVKHAEVR